VTAGYWDRDEVEGWFEGRLTIWRRHPFRPGIKPMPAG
jgi:hypothetical protein